ncbi:MAG TPA: hypothetical protein VE441_14560 [Mycobacterium sp.]|jgi:hypothetical protein|nr:hypothetical protein [Mycobacterium sp.]
MRTEDLDRLDREINQTRSAPAQAYAEALEPGLAACAADADVTAYIDVLELHSELCPAPGPDGSR